MIVTKKRHEALRSQLQGQIDALYEHCGQLTNGLTRLRDELDPHAAAERTEQARRLADKAVSDITAASAEVKAFITGYMGPMMERFEQVEQQVRSHGTLLDRAVIRP